MDTVLFDADGVLQRPARRLFAALPRERREAVLADVWASGADSLVGAGELEPRLAAVLADHGLSELLAGLLDDWYAISPVPQALTFVDELRGAGVRCVVASNQDHDRARIMSGELGYGTRFDVEGYSCDLGVAKPDEAFFRRLLELVGASAATTTFVDDHEPNVAAARSLGITAVLADPDDSTSWISAVHDLVGVPNGS